MLPGLHMLLTLVEGQSDNEVLRNTDWDRMGGKLFSF